MLHGVESLLSTQCHKFQNSWETPEMLHNAESLVIYMADEFQDELNFLGIEPSPSFVREPEGNGCAERFIGLLKENLLWVRTFATIEELRLALIDFKHVYNEQWILQRHDYKTPAQVRREKRQIQYAEAAG